MMFRIIHGHCALDVSSFFILRNSSTRGYKFKLMKQFSRVNCRVSVLQTDVSMRGTVWAMMLSVLLLCQFLNIVLNVFLREQWFYQ